MCQFFKKMRCCQRDTLHDLCSGGELHVFPSPSVWMNLAAYQRMITLSLKRHEKSLLHGNAPTGRLLKYTSILGSHGVKFMSWKYCSNFALAQGHGLQQHLPNHFQRSWADVTFACSASLAVLSSHELKPVVTK